MPHIDAGEGSGGDVALLDHERARGTRVSRHVADPSPADPLSRGSICGPSLMVRRGPVARDGRTGSVS
jgi:hypothetical protein